jgi:hypothetical protein
MPASRLTGRIPLSVIASQRGLGDNRRGPRREARQPWPRSKVDFRFDFA